MKLDTCYIVFFIFFIVTSCTSDNKEFNNNTLSKNDTIKIVTLNTPDAHYIFNQKDYGYHYELINEFVQSNKLNYKITYTNSIDSAYYYLDNQLCDIVAYNILPKPKYFPCGDTIYSTVNIIKCIQNDSVKKTTDINRINIHYSNKFHNERIALLSEEIGYNISTQYTDNNIDSILYMINNNKIDYCVCYENVSNLYKYKYYNIDNSIRISLPYKLSWCSNDEKLARKINTWFNNRKYRETRTVNFYKYLVTKGKKDFRGLNINNRIISNYDHLFKKEAKEINMDWKLLAALCYNESKFDPEQISNAGAIGIMQIMPITAKAFSIEPKELIIPEVNIYIASRYIKALNKYFAMIDNSEERIKFVIGAYNSGVGHIYDAMALAKKYNKNSYLWDNVVEFLILKSKNKYYNDEVCKYGYFNGKQTEILVKNTLNTYKYYLLSF